jgi:phosphoribosylaminoimidazolecarboxamide formyltransferase/IMP cyclohydrolase
MGKTVKVGRALLSVFDKTGMADFARGLAEAGVELVSTGGTHKLIADTGLKVREISDLTGFPEMMDGRVKTLHPKVHGGLLSVRDNPEHRASMDEHDIGPIDLVAVNLYPFEKTVASGASYDQIIENIDIGGPAMVRSAAKNHAFVTVVVDPADYPAILEAIRAGGIPYALRQKLAAKAYAHRCL